MKKLFSIFTIAACVSAIVSCQKEEQGGLPVVNPDGMRTETVTVSAPVTKTVLGEDGTSVLWTTSDQLAILTYSEEKDNYTLATDPNPKDPNADKLEYNKYVKPSAAGKNAEISFKLGDSYVSKYVVYPYRQTTNINTRVSTEDVDMTGLRTKVETTQEPVKGTWAKNANASVGAIKGQGSNRTAEMVNLLTLLKFEIEKEDIVEIKFSANAGEHVAGFAYFSVEDWGFQGFSKGYQKTEDEFDVQDASSLGQTITIANKNGNSFEPGVYYLPIVPQEYTEGICLTLSDAAGNVQEKKQSSSFTAKKNLIYDLGKDSEWGLTWPETPVAPENPETKELYLFFNDRVGDDSNYNHGWPFDSPEASGDMRTLLKDNKTTLTYCQDGVNYEFIVYVQNTGDKKNFRYTNGGGLNYGGTSGDYLEFPAIENHRLKSVSVFGGGTYKAKITDTAGQDVVSAKDANKTSAITYELKSSEVNASYRLQLVEDEKCVTIRQLWLNYLPVSAE